MADAYTAVDALGIYLTGKAGVAEDIYTPADSLGGMKINRESRSLEALMTWPIPPLVLEWVSPACGEGDAFIRGASAESVAFVAPGATEGAAVTLAKGGRVLAVDDDTDHAVRIYRDDAYSDDNLGGRMTLSLRKVFENAISHGNVSSAQRDVGVDTYRALMLRAHGDVKVENIKVWVAPLHATGVVSDVDQLPLTGVFPPFKIETSISGAFDDWPAAGWVRINTSAGALREIVYYNVRTGTSLFTRVTDWGLLGSTHSAGAADDVVYSVPGIRLALEAVDGDNLIQEIADEETAPAAVSWDSDITSATGLDFGDLLPGEQAGLWIHREIISGINASVQVESRIGIQFDVDGITYAYTPSGLYRIADATVARDLLYVGQDARPDFSASEFANSTARPWSTALAAPPSGTREYQLTVVERNDYNLDGLNRKTHRFLIDSGGNDVTPELVDPEDISLTNITGGEVDVQATYQPRADADPADTWLLYVTTNGVDPNPGSDTPTEVAITAASSYGLTPARKLLHTLGPNDYGTDLRVLVRVQRSGDSEESGNTAISQITVATQNPVRVNWTVAMLGQANALAPGLPFDVTETIDATYSVKIRLLPGESQLWWGSVLVWRALWPGKIFMADDWTLENVTISGAGVATAIEAVSATEGYICVNSIRRVKIDVAGKKIQAAQFQIPVALTDETIEAATYADATHSVFQVWDHVAGRWRPYFEATSAGLNAALELVQEQT